MSSTVISSPAVESRSKPILKSKSEIYSSDLSQQFAAENELATGGQSQKLVGNSWGLLRVPLETHLILPSKN